MLVFPDPRSPWLTFSDVPKSNELIRAAGELCVPQLRINGQMLGGIETPRLCSTRGPQASLGGLGAHIYFDANASRHRPAVALHFMGA
jgi:hypothetical protein